MNGRLSFSQINNLAFIVGSNFYGEVYFDFDSRKMDVQKSGNFTNLHLPSIVIILM